MSDYQDDALKAKTKLDEFSPTMCLAKWMQTSIHLTTGHTNSCYHCPQHKIDTTHLESAPNGIHFTFEKRDQQNAMIEGKRPDACSYCWTIEDKGHLSDRHYRSGEPWAFERYDDIITSMALASPRKKREVTNPSYVEVNFNSACNLACSYCSPQFSSTWMAHAKQHGAYPTLTPHNDPNYFTGDRRPIPQREYNPYLEAFWKWWPDLYKDLKHFRMTGGEPLMDKNTYRVFDYILENPKPDLHLNVTSNFSVEPELFTKYMDYAKRLCEGEKIEHFMQFVSLDGFGAQAEYMRAGLDFNLLWDNVNRFLNDIPGRNSVTFIITMNNLSITSLHNLLTAIYGLRELYSTTYQRVWFDVPLLRNPRWQSIQILSDAYSYKLEKLIGYMENAGEAACPQFTGFKDYEIAKLKRNLDYMRINLSDETLREDRINFYRFFSEYDKRHGTNFENTFPEMIDFWDECRYWSNSK